MIYLYLKTHNQTQKKYLGKTVKSDPHLYKGSGILWTKHIEKYGYDVTTEILRVCETTEEITKWGLYYSELYNVVESQDFLNLKEESGDGGGYGVEYSKIHSERMKNEGNPMYGKKHTEMSIKKMSENSKGEKNGMYGKEGSWKGKKNPNSSVKVQCPHCGKIGNRPPMMIFHFDKCKLVDPTYKQRMKERKQKYMKSFTSTKVKKDCEYCGKEFEHFPSQKRKYCSNSCSSKLRWSRR